MTKAIGYRPSQVRGTLEHFKCQRWKGINRRTINGKKPDPKKYKSYFRRRIEVRMTKSEFHAWCDEHAKEILSMYAEGKTPSVDRIDPNGHYEPSNIRILDKKLNVANTCKVIAESEAATVVAKNARAMAKILNVDPSSISHAIRGKTKTIKGYKIKAVV